MRAGVVTRRRAQPNGGGGRTSIPRPATGSMPASPATSDLSEALRADRLWADTRSYALPINHTDLLGRT
jgi:hypothetical protein